MKKITINKRKYEWLSDSNNIKTLSNQLEGRDFKDSIFIIISKLDNKGFDIYVSCLKRHKEV